MTTPNQLIDQMESSRLKVCVKELMERRKTSILCNGQTREFSRALGDICGIPSDIRLRLAEDLILQEAARRYAEPMYMNVSGDEKVIVHQGNITPDYSEILANVAEAAFEALASLGEQPLPLWVTVLKSYRASKKGVQA